MRHRSAFFLVQLFVTLICISGLSILPVHDRLETQQYSVQVVDKFIRTSDGTVFYNIEYSLPSGSKDDISVRSSRYESISIGSYVSVPIEKWRAEPEKYPLSWYHHLALWVGLISVVGLLVTLFLWFITSD